MKLILLNGPPRSGKDTAGLALRAALTPDYPTVLEKFSRPIKRAFAATVNANLLENDHVQFYEDNKQEYMSTFKCSYRQWQIDFSEKFMKPLYGATIFGNLLLSRIEQYEGSDTIIIVTDCGFQIEVDTVLKMVNPKDVCIIRLYRNYSTFDGDSRQYVHGPTITNSDGDLDSACYETMLTNNKTKEDFEKRTIFEVRWWLGFRAQQQMREQLETKYSKDLTT